MDTYRYDELNDNEVMVTTYDRLLRTWMNSMEMVRDFEMHSKRIEEEEIKSMFKKFAEEEGMHASKLKEMLLKYKNGHQSIKKDFQQ